MTNPQKLSIVMPVFNAQEWVKLTATHLMEAAENSSFDVELVIVDDGSTDRTLEKAKRLRPKSGRFKVKVISQENKGRYIARKVGVESAKHPHIMFIDSRIFIHPGALAFLSSRLKKSMDQVWNAHVIVDKVGNIYARFWDSIVRIAWRRYFNNPTETSYGIKEFDYYPKGTTLFYVPKKLLQDAMKSFESESSGSKYSNDDTLLIRFIAEKEPIHLSPQFSCVYHSRSTLRTFLKHAFHRGQVFVDGFLMPGNRFFLPLIGFLLISLAAVLSFILFPLIFIPAALIMTVVATLVLFLMSVALGLEWRDGVSLSLLSPIFIIVYGSGIWRGVLRKLAV